MKYLFNVLLLPPLLCISFETVAMGTVESDMTSDSMEVDWRESEYVSDCFTEFAQICANGSGPHVSLREVQYTCAVNSLLAC